MLKKKEWICLKKQTTENAVCQKQSELGFIKIYLIFMIKEHYKYSELTSKIIKCAMAVHSALGWPNQFKIQQTYK